MLFRDVLITTNKAYYWWQ